MENSDSPSDEILGQAVKEINEPILFQRLLQDATGAYTWELLKWNLSELAEKFGDIKLPFRIGYNSRSVHPQWEVNCSTTSMTLSKFITNVNTNETDEKWYYFDYKYMHEWFESKPEILDSVNWKRFGFDKSGSDSTLWIGSKGAHTNCHQDSYGCNLVAQIHGRKQWLLCPPSSVDFLSPTRVPYEESTVYSKYNFFCPTAEDQINILKIQDQLKLVTLEPGDVLLVPAGWWHYVESLDFSVSVNIWLPIVTDNLSRIKEAIVKLIVARIGTNVCTLPAEEQHTLPSCMKLLDIAIDEYINMEMKQPPTKKLKSSAWRAEELAARYPIYVKLLRGLTSAELEAFLKAKGERFSEDSIGLVKDNSTKTNVNIQNDFLNSRLPEDIVNAFCHPDVVNKVADLLLSP